MAVPSIFCRWTRETAEIIAAWQPGEVSVVTTPELRECNYSLWEGLTRAEVAVRFAEDWDNWNKRRLTESPTGGEDFLSLARRAGRAFDAAVQGGKTVLISTHRGTLRAVLCHALRLDPTDRDRFLVMNCSLSALECRPRRRPRLILLDDTSHLNAVSLETLSGTGLQIVREAEINIPKRERRAKPAEAVRFPLFSFSSSV